MTLTELANRAVHGEWKHDSARHAITVDGRLMCEFHAPDGDDVDEAWLPLRLQQANCEYVAAIDPKTILALIAVARAARTASAWFGRGYAPNTPGHGRGDEVRKLLHDAVVALPDSVRAEGCA